MEINFGISGLSGLLRPAGQQAKDKDKSKSSKKKLTSTNSANTLPPRRWSFKLPKLVERKEENTNSSKTGKARLPPSHRPPLVRSESDVKQRAWVTKILLNEKEQLQSGRQAKTDARNNFEMEEEERGVVEVEEEEEKDSASLSSIVGDDLINLQIKEMYSSPLLDVTIPDIYTRTQSRPFLEQEFYENSENSGSNATVESFVDDVANETCSFEDIDTIMDNITENVNEMDLYDNVANKDDEMEDDGTKDDNSSKTSSEDIIITFNDKPKLKGKGSILKHPGQKRRHIKHVEFLDLISDDQGNCENVRYF